MINLSNFLHGQGGRLEHLTGSHSPPPHWQEVACPPQEVSGEGWPVENCKVGRAKPGASSFSGHNGELWKTWSSSWLLCWWGWGWNELPNAYFVVWVWIFIYGLHAVTHCGWKDYTQKNVMSRIFWLHLNQNKKSFTFEESFAITKFFF